MPGELAMKSHLYRLTLLGSVLGALTLNTALADNVAAHEINSNGITVSFGDLNLSSPVGLDSLYQRVESAALKACGVDNVKDSLDIVRLNRECVSSSINNAISKIGDSRLTALHQIKLAEDHQS